MKRRYSIGSPVAFDCAAILLSSCASPYFGATIEHALRNLRNRLHLLGEEELSEHFITSVVHIAGSTAAVKVLNALTHRAERDPSWEISSDPVPVHERRLGAVLFFFLDETPEKDRQLRLMCQLVHIIHGLARPTVVLQQFLEDWLVEAEIPSDLHEIFPELADANAS